MSTVLAGGLGAPPVRLFSHLTHRSSLSSPLPSLSLSCRSCLNGPLSVYSCRFAATTISAQSRGWQQLHGSRYSLHSLATLVVLNWSLISPWFLPWFPTWYLVIRLRLIFSLSGNNHGNNHGYLPDRIFAWYQGFFPVIRVVGKPKQFRFGFGQKYRPKYVSVSVFRLSSFSAFCFLAEILCLGLDFG